MSLLKAHLRALFVGVATVAALLFAGLPAQAACTLGVDNPSTAARAEAGLLPIDTPLCGNRNDFLKLRTPKGHEFCFANAGSMGLAGIHINYLSAGNNKGALWVVNEGHCGGVFFEKWQVKHFHPPVSVAFVEIY
ncbi:hypothetical protein GCM10012275_39120 [Longimycelium tulufanense]|uniref:Uncharacterized protein n=1 Tax=Longimycelium tulufanense TaxID=907463 RepID=A0A8J3FVM2_9PSEU|nr:hypothetical protein [Longimycelium tulufanense]GGM64683.1 hypothetical protein GCM10012275_39120 [Longimycelium tulufanense]